jgi:site-specific recombinase XerD
MENTKFHNLQQEFLKELESKGKSFNTVKNYKADLNCFNKFMDEKAKSSEFAMNLNSVQVQEYATYIEKKYDSANSKRRRIQALRLFYDYLISKALVSENPIKKIVTAPKIVDIPRPVLMGDINRLYNLVHSKYLEANGLMKLIYLRNQLINILIYGAGLKVSDIARLKEDHILLGADGMYRVIITPNKRDPFTTPLPKVFNTLYQKYISTLAIQKEKQGIEFNNLLFNANPYQILAGGISPRGCEIIYKDLAKELNIELTARSLRQSCIFKWIIQGVNKTRIKEWMGVQPQYSLRPFTNLIADDPEKYKFVELTDQSYDGFVQ